MATEAEPCFHIGKHYEFEVLTFMGGRVEDVVVGLRSMRIQTTPSTRADKIRERFPKWISYGISLHM